MITVQEGNNPINRFLITRVEKPKPNHTLAGVFVVLPPLGSGFKNYEATADGDYNNSFAGFFARRNYAVVGYSRREDGITAGSCESGAIDCSPMAEWGLQTIVDDVAYIRQHITQEYPGFTPKIGGLSMGSIAAMATVNAYPNDYSGAFLIEGTLHDTDPAVQAINAGFCTQFETLLAAGVFYDGQSGPGVKFLSQMAQVAPDQPNVFPGFPPGLTFHQAFVFALSETPLSPLSPRPGYSNLAGSVLEDRFFFANEPVVHANIATFLDYTTIRSLRDLNCGLAGETTFTNNLGNYNGPVIMFAAGHAFGPAMFDTAQLMSSANVTLNSNANYGHVDYMFSNNHVRELEQPILKWLKDN
jgi:pimeloyl-ACP methyl ester carboxylesterase